MNAPYLIATCCAVITLSGCSSKPVDPSLLASAVIGASGGVLEGPGIALRLPAGALTEATELSISISEERPAGVIPLSPVYRFEPAGLAFTQPVTVTIDAPGAGPGSVLLWTRQGDPTRFEFAGFVENEVASAQVTHFSLAVVDSNASEPNPDAEVTEECPDGESASQCGDACAGGAPGEGACPGDVTCDAAEPCRRICDCISDDRVDRLCYTDPGDPRGPCPETNAMIGPIMVNGGFERDAWGTEVLAKRNGDACMGWAIRPIEMPACTCELVGEAGTPVCPRGRWVNLAEEPLHNWRCESDVNGNEPGVYADHRVMNDMAIQSFTGREGDSCFGQTIDPDSQMPVRQRRAARLVGCDVRIVGHEYLSLPGRTQSCQVFAWAGPTPNAAAESIDRAQCRLSDEDWMRLTNRRDDCGVPARAVDAGDAGGWGRGEGHTLAILDAWSADGSPEPEITGLNGRSGGAQPLRAAAVAAGTCPPPLARDFTPDDGGAAVRYSGAGRSTCHAEGDALSQLAASRGRRPLGLPDLAEGGRSGGRAEMIVDRNACLTSCGPYGVDRMRQMAGLDEIVVRQPGGTFRYASDLPPSGVLVD